LFILIVLLTFIFVSLIMFCIYIHRRDELHTVVNCLGRGIIFLTQSRHVLFDEKLTSLVIVVNTQGTGWPSL
jgi:hypothetical protein